MRLRNVAARHCCLGWTRFRKGNRSLTQIEANDLIGDLRLAAQDGVVVFPDDEKAHTKTIEKVLFYAEYSRRPGRLV